jgi:HTH-type transcriptional regulator/antitoxin HigA
MKLLIKTRKMGIYSIRTEADYEVTLAEIERLFDAAPNTPEGDRLDVFTTLVEAYELRHYPIPESDPIEAIKYYMESRGLSRSDLEPYIGSRARVTEVLNRKRPLSLKHDPATLCWLGHPSRGVGSILRCGRRKGDLQDFVMVRHHP